MENEASRFRIPNLRGLRLNPSEGQALPQIQADLEDQRRQQMKPRPHKCYQRWPGVRQKGPDVALLKWESAKEVSPMQSAEVVTSDTVLPLPLGRDL
ncbi:hypothetical protein AVEN_263590-1 [Araneus ventricosus]|uniref:Uncharacterized protein n=1 Tax=Araneus ventricosus TaxID=182803 RepID=A0A4Y2HZG7_ARAVE|nr:hypothetical protein AVEN_263590-1 [Araneus ventricosus]